MSIMPRKVVCIMGLIFPLLFGIGIAGAEVDPQSGGYYEQEEMLKVKVLGGYVIHSRNRIRGKWVFDLNSASLVVTRDALDNEIRSVSRNGMIYEPADGSGKRFRFGRYRFISVTESGFRWADRAGNWINYDEQGRALSYGDRNNVSVTFEYDDSGRRVGVKDHLGTQVLWYSYYPNGLLDSVRDYSGREVQYEYDDEGRLITATDVDGHDWAYAYSSQGWISSRTNPNSAIHPRLRRFSSRAAL